MTNRENAGALPLDHSGQPSTAPVSTASFHCRSRLTTNTHILLLLVIAVRTLASGLLSSPNHFPEDSSAPRRRLAAGGATSSCLPVQQAVSRAGRCPHRRAVIVPSTAGAVHKEHSSASQRTAARRGSPGRPVPAVRSHHVRVLSQTPSVRRPVSGVNVWCPGVRCPRGVSSVQASGAGVCLSGCPMPVWASGFRAFLRPLRPNRVRFWSTAMGWQPDGGGVRVVAQRYPRRARWLPQSEPRARSRRRCAGPAGRRPGLGRRRGKELRSGPGRPRGHQAGPDTPGDRCG
jgi:hypothetical protein